VTILEV